MKVRRYPFSSQRALIDHARLRQTIRRQRSASRGLDTSAILGRAVRATTMPAGV